ncbi:MAG TPA: putative Ig domain-containing protein, partial [candidate division Zixibacteria bacterium]|nr:putative Ig domain-containing protein [candidate division Zixibacteria bacterium]
MQTGCALCASAQNWVAAFTNPNPPPDTIYQVLSLLQVPRLRNGNFLVDTAITTECNVANDCDPRAGFTVQCINNVCVYTPVSTGCSSSAGCPDISGFTKACINNECVYTPITGSHAPTVDDIVPNFYSVLQGELVTFTVTGRDTSASHTITLSASGMPAGATFNATPGQTQVTGTFSWTPNFSQSGAYVISFSASDNTGKTSAPKSVTINVEELQFDQLFTTSAEDMAPVGGIPGFREPVLFPVDLLSLQPAVYGIQFDLMYPHRQIRIDSIITTDRTPTYVVDWVQMSDSLLRVVSLGLDNEPILSGTSSAVLQVALTIDSNATPGVYDMLMSNGRESIDPNPAVGSVELLTLPGIVEVDLLGDVNIDRYIDVADMVNIVAYIIGNYGLPPRNFATADVTKNDTVDVVDLVGVSNLIFNLPIQPAPSFEPGGGPLATVVLDGHSFESGGYSALQLIGDFPEDVAGIEVQVTYNPATISVMPPELTEASDDYVLRYRNDGKGALKAVIYSFSPLSQDKIIKEGVAEV